MKFAMKKIQPFLLLILSTSLTVSLLAGNVEKDHRIQGDSASSVIDSTGALVILYKTPQGGLIKARQSTGSHGYTIQEITPDINVSAPLIKQDRQGKLWAIWEQEAEGNHVILFSPIRENNAGPPEVVSPVMGIHFSADFCFDFGNHAWITWISYIDGENHLLVKDLNRQSTWLVNGPHFNSVCQPKITLDNSGKVWVIWSGNVDGRDQVLCVSWDGTQWTTPFHINRESDVPNIFPDIAVDADGFPWVTWSFFDGDDYEIAYSFWNGHVWSEQQRVTDNTDADLHPSLSFISGGIPVVVWNASSGRQSMISCRYRSDGTWSPEICLHSSKIPLNESPKIATQGTTIGLVWQEGLVIHTQLLSLRELIHKNTIRWEDNEEGTAQQFLLDENAYIGFGDSITYGMMDYEYTPELGYIPRLESHLSTLYGPTDVMNEGWPGELTHQGLARISSVLDQHKARYFLLMEGTNDVIFNNISMDTTAFNLEQMIRICRKKDVFPIISTIIPRKDWRWDNSFYRQRIFDLNDKIRDRVQKGEVAFADMFDIYYSWPAYDGGWRSLLSTDKVHPNEKGYTVMAQSWLDEIRILPFPVTGFRVARLQDKVGDFTYEANNLMWLDSTKWFDKTLFRGFYIYRAEVSGSASAFTRIDALAVEPGGARIAGTLSFPNFDNFQRKYLDTSIDYSRYYKYYITLVRKDGVEGPASTMGQDTH